jgi:hypothetical protein
MGWVLKRFPVMILDLKKKIRGVNPAEKLTSHRITWDFEKYKCKKFACSGIAVKKN